MKVAQSCPTLCDPVDYIYSPWNSPGQNTGVGSLSLLQGIFPTQGLNPGLPHCRQILYPLSHKGSPTILEWVACPFFRVSSQPRNWTGVSHIAGGFSTNWTTREAPKVIIRHQNQAKSIFFPTVLSKCKPKCQKYLAPMTVFTKRFPIRIISTIILALIAL